MIVNSEHKKCSRCNEILPLESFARDRRKPTGRGAWCRGCQAEYRRGRRIYGHLQCQLCKTTQPRKEFTFVNGRCGRVCNICRTDSHRRCPGCGERKSKQDFYLCRGRPAGWCKECKQQAARQDREIKRLAKQAAGLPSQGELRAIKDFKKKLSAQERAQRRAKELEARKTATHKVCKGRKGRGCGQLKPIEAFPAVKKCVGGRANICHSCDHKRRKLSPNFKEVQRRSRKKQRSKPHNRKKRRNREREREMRRLKAMPRWLTMDQRRRCFKIYQERDRLTLELGLPHHVDHIIPLRGKEMVNGYLVEVWGLHVPWNLRPMIGKENEDKHNSFLGIARELFENERDFLNGVIKKVAS